jgi:hypothetical protein
MAALSARLKACMDRGSLTLADLARWFGRPHATVRTWYTLNREPREGYRDEVLRRLKMLEDEIIRRRGVARFPGPFVPVEITKRERPLYLKRRYNEANKRLSKKRVA